MKIITIGEIPKKRTVTEICHNCKTVFEYTESDVHKGAGQAAMRYADSYVVCPICKIKIISGL